eukprot:gene9272-11364_t
MFVAPDHQHPHHHPKAHDLKQDESINLQILYELTSFNIIYYLKSSNDHVDEDNKKSDQREEGEEYHQRKRSLSGSSGFLVSQWVIDCLIKSPTTMIESYFQTLLEPTPSSQLLSKLSTLKTYIKEYNTNNKSNNKIKDSEINRLIRKHIVSLFSTSSSSSSFSSKTLSLDSKKIQFILHSLLPSFTQRLLHNLISDYKPKEENNIVIELIDILMNDKSFQNQIPLLQTHFLHPILQCLGNEIEESTTSTAKILYQLINDDTRNELLFGRNFGFGVNASFSGSQLEEGYSSIQTLLKILIGYSSETQNRFYKQWEDFLTRKFTNNDQISQCFWQIRQLILYYNQLPLELCEMTKRVLFLFLKSLSKQKSQFDSKKLNNR